MNDVHALLDRWSLDDEPRDWSDVLRRAGRRRVRAGSLPAALVVLGIVLAAAPALGLDDGLRSFIDRDEPVVQAGAALAGPSGLAGRISIRTRGVVVVHPGSRRVIPLIPRGRTPRGGPPATRIDWTLTVRGGDASRAVLLRRGQVVVRLCAPCRSGASGRVELRAVEAVALFNGRTAVRVDTSAGMLRGTIRPRLPRPPG